MLKTGQFYAGSSLLTFVVDLVGLPLDQVNFLFCQVVALFFAFPFRIVFSAKQCSAETRHTIELVLGVSLAYFCFGYQIYHLFVLSVICYLIMLSGQSWMHKAVFLFAMSYLSITHIFRQMYDYGGYTLDITGPMMIMVQKLTSFGFAYHDGFVKSEEELSPEQQKMAIKELPNLLTFLSYLFYFHGIMCGPFVFYSDYMEFIDGRNFSEAKIPELTEGDTRAIIPPDQLSPLKVVAQNLFTAIFFGIVMVGIVPFYSPDYLVGQEFYRCSLLERHFYLLIIISLVRSKYYFAWKLGEAVNNAAGLGFHGYDKHGNPKWDLVNNVDIYRLELCSSLRVNVECWNKTSTRWLRQVVYERATLYRTLSVFTVSAIWHGFYPGYYVTFATGALFTHAAREVRRRVRPYFLRSARWKMFYDVVTFTATRLANVIMCAPFTVLEYKSSLRLMGSLYWWMHILAGLAICYFHILSPTKRHDEKKTQ